MYYSDSVRYILLGQASNLSGILPEMVKLCYVELFVNLV